MLDQLTRYIWMRKGLVFIVVICTVVVGVLIMNTFFDSNPQESVVVQQEELNALSYDRFNQLPEITDAKREINKSKNFPQVEIVENFTETEVTRVNTESFVYKVQSLSEPEISSTYSSYGYTLQDTGDLMVFIGNSDPNTFITNHIDNLNSSVVEGRGREFNSLVVSQKLLGSASDSEAIEVDRLENATHRSTVYQIRFGNTPFFINSKSSNISVFTDLVTGSSKITMANFFPAKITPDYTVVFEPGSYTLTPGVSENPEFLNYYVNNDVVLDNSSFLTTFDSGVLVYGYTSDQQLLFPILSKSSSLKESDFSGLTNRRYFLISD